MTDDIFQVNICQVKEAMGKKIARALGMTDAEYRRTLVKLRARIRIIENNLREKDYTFDYAAQPSKAMFKYRAAFIRNDGERYGAFMAQVEKGEKTLHTGTPAADAAFAPSKGERKATSDLLFICGYGESYSYTKEAIRYINEQQQKSIKLIDGALLTDLLIKYHIGIMPVQTFSLFRIDSDYYLDS